MPPNITPLTGICGVVIDGWGNYINTVVVFKRGVAQSG